MERREHRLAPRRQAQVDDLDPLPDRPFDGRRERATLAPVVGAEHADRHDVGARRDAGDDPGTRRPVADEVARLEVVDDVGVLAVEVDPQVTPDPARHGRDDRRRPRSR